MCSSTTMRLGLTQNRTFHCLRRCWPSSRALLSRGPSSELISKPKRVQPPFMSWFSSSKTNSLLMHANGNKIWWLPQEIMFLIQALEVSLAILAQMDQAQLTDRRNMSSLRDALVKTSTMVRKAHSRLSWLWWLMMESLAVAIELTFLTSSSKRWAALQAIIRCIKSKQWSTTMGQRPTWMLSWRRKWTLENHQQGALDGQPLPKLHLQETSSQRHQQSHTRWEMAPNNKRLSQKQWIFESLLIWFFSH